MKRKGTEKEIKNTKRRHERIVRVSIMRVIYSETSLIRAMHDLPNQDLPCYVIHCQTV